MEKWKDLMNLDGIIIDRSKQSIIIFSTKLYILKNNNFYCFKKFKRFKYYQLFYELWCMFRWKTKSKVEKILKFVEHLQKIYIYLPLRGLKRLKSKIYELKIWFFNTESTPWSYLVFHSFLTFCNFQHFLLLIILIIILRSGAVASRRPHTKVVARCALRTSGGTGHIQSLYF
jgi:hypothetical protein